MLEMADNALPAVEEISSCCVDGATSAQIVAAKTSLFQHLLE
jgi:hypothetical protein